MRTPQDAHKHLIDYLSNTYGDHLMTRDGVTYPVYFYPAQKHAIDSWLAPDAPQSYLIAQDLPIYDQQYLDVLRGNRPNITNGLSYIMDRFSPEMMQVTGKLGYYFDMLATCDALDHEMRRYVQGKQKTLPLREQLHAAIPPQELFFTGAGRCALIGIGTLTVFRHEGQYKLLVGHRARTLAVGAGLFHVMPAFVFQPSRDDPEFIRAEWALGKQLEREYGEEIFGMPEFHNWPGADTPDYFAEHPGIVDLRAMVADGRAGMEFTGFAINPLSTRPEATTLLIIHDDDWYPRWAETFKTSLFTEHQETHFIPLDTLDGLPDDLHMRMTPHGTAALWQGIDRARTLIKTS